VLGRDALVLSAVLLLPVVERRLVDAFLAGTLSDEARGAVALFNKASLATALVAVLTTSVLRTLVLIT
jgi:hypothetical protein